MQSMPPVAGAVVGASVAAGVSVAGASVAGGCVAGASVAAGVLVAPPHAERIMAISTKRLANDHRVDLLFILSPLKVKSF